MTGPSPTAAAESSTGSISLSQSGIALPEIRTFSLLEPLPVPRQPTNDSIVTSSSATSHDTFMTALTSTPSPSSPATAAAATSSKLNVTSSHSLRKSISVDSFINSRRSPDLAEAGTSSSVQQREYTRDRFDSENGANISPEEWSYSSRNAGASVRYTAANRSLATRILGRARGHSLSGPSASDYDDPYLDDSDHERTADMAHLPLLGSHRSYTASSPFANGLGKGKAKARPGDALLLPPRTQTLSAASSASSLSSSVGGVTFAETVPPVPPIPHPHVRRTNAPDPLVLPHRIRSGSLGHRNGRSTLNSNEPIYSIAVVGAPGSGKTTLIKRGLKKYEVSEETICTAATSNGRIRYGSRTFKSKPDEEPTALVFDLNSDLLHLDSPESAWPEGLPPIEGVLVCYDASDPASFVRVPDLLACYSALHLSAIVLACKSDLEKKVSPLHASERAAPYHVGLIEISEKGDVDRRKMRSCFAWMFRSIESVRRGEMGSSDSSYHNPASPDMLNAPWSDGYGHSETHSGSVKSRVSTPSAGSPSTTKFREHQLATAVLSPSPTNGTSTPTPRPPSAPISPTRIKSTNDLMSEVERSRQAERLGEGVENGVKLHRAASLSAGSLHEPSTRDQTLSLEVNDTTEVKDAKSGKADPPAMPWATLEEMLDKLFFLAVSGDDPTFIKHFFLTYRRFCTPRSVLLGMQKRVRQLNQEHSNILLGSYAQMRICDLLEDWIESFPHDFATPGTSGAIHALVKQISSNPCTLHYGSDILPFLDELHTLQDIDSSWGIQTQDPQDESDDDFDLLDDDDYEGFARERPSDVPPPYEAPDTGTGTSQVRSKSSTISTRERKGSLPLSTKSLIVGQLASTLTVSSDITRNNVDRAGHIPRNSPKDLVRLSQTLATYDPLDIAQQITKIQTDLFLAIEPRQWLRYTMGDARKDPIREPISACANFYNHLANWVSSLILAHDRVRTREKQVERFIELANKLRILNNYNGLRAIMTGINNATFPNDEIMTMLNEIKQPSYRTFLSYEILLNSQHNHRAYRMALRHTNGPAIPDMEVHTFDMVRAHESNINYHPDDPNKIHWGKYTLMARMITMLQGLQDKIRASDQFVYPERKWIREMLENDVMDEHTIRSRVFLPADDAEPPIFPLAQGAQGLDSPNATRTDAVRFKRLFFW